MKSMNRSAVLRMLSGSIRNAFSLVRAANAANGLISKPMVWCPEMSASTRVVPTPANGSRTTHGLDVNPLIASSTKYLEYPAIHGTHRWTGASRLPMNAGSRKALPFGPMPLVEADWKASEVAAGRWSACGLLDVTLNTGFAMPTLTKGRDQGLHKTKGCGDRGSAPSSRHASDMQHPRLATPRTDCEYRNMSPRP